jgi:anti-anti-sigma regulatory factor
MQINILVQETQTVIEIHNIVKTINDTIEIKEKISSILQKNPNEQIILDFIDTFVIPSALIGILQKFILADKAKISITARESQLYELFDNLHLLDQLNVTKINKQEV